MGNKGIHPSSTKLETGTKTWIFSNFSFNAVKAPAHTLQQKTFFFLLTSFLLSFQFFSFLFFFYPRRRLLHCNCLYLLTLWCLMMHHCDIFGEKLHVFPQKVLQVVPLPEESQCQGIQEIPAQTPLQQRLVYWKNWIWHLKSPIWLLLHCSKASLRWEVERRKPEQRQGGVYGL